MKLATYKDGSRDGQLVVVSRDLGWAHYATAAAHTLQDVLDDWNFVAPQLQDLSLELERGRARHAFPFDPAQCMAPLPRASQCIRVSACGSHRAHLAESGIGTASGTRVTGLGAPDLVTLSGDAMQGARDPMALPDEAWGLDFEAGLAVIAADLSAGSPPARALQAVRLVMLANTWCLRHTQAQEWASGVAPVHSRPAQAFGPVAVTPDELGDAWHQGRLGLMLHTHWNGRRVGLTDCSVAMTLHWGQLLAQAAATRALRAGTVVTSGPMSAAALTEASERHWPSGVHCVAEKRALEVLQQGQASTGYLRWGDHVSLELKSRDGHSPLGVLAQTVVEAGQG